MHISKLQIVNYRNFERATVRFAKGINTIIGENGSGKTNLFRAMRLLLDDTLLRMAYRLDEKDFHRGIGDWRGHWIIISLEFTDVSQDEAIQSLFLHGTGNVEGPVVGKATYNLIFRPKAAIRLKLSELKPGDAEGLIAYRQTITTEDYETIFTGKSTADFCDKNVYKSLVGDFSTVSFPKELVAPTIGGPIPGMLSITKEVCLTFVQALRDVVAEFQNNRTNPLLTLLRSKSGEIDAENFEEITALVRNLNKGIETLPDVESIRHDIRTTITEAAGETYSPRSLSIKSDLSEEADKLFQSLKLFVGESDEAYEGPIHELSLGGANLIYLTLKLLEFHYQKAKQSFANFLLIEEPEAHIHTHIQKTLFDRLDYVDTQVIYSTHSTHISEVSNVENINILGRREGLCEVFQPATGLSPEEIGNIQRYLDAVRSNLLFAKSVILVEGDAEEILIPIMAKEVLGLSLDELGVSLINIRSTGFRNVAILFHNERIRKRCAIITDLDAPFIDTTPNALDDEQTKTAKARASSSHASGLARQTILTAFVSGNAWVTAHYAPHTFEVDLLAAGNAAKFIKVAPNVYTDPATITASQTELASRDIAISGTRALRMANHVGKGWFAVILGKAIDPHTAIPDYILAALFTAHQPVSRGIFCAIASYRRGLAVAAGSLTGATSDMLVSAIEQYRQGSTNLDMLRAAVLAALPGDQLNHILEGFSGY
jgi:putative ATP-dependent endonuclease of the OLD family